MHLFEPLHSIIQTYLPTDKIEWIQRAFVVARDAHEGQTRSSGEPYITHPVAVATIIAEMIPGIRRPAVRSSYSLESIGTSKQLQPTVAKVSA